MSVAMDEEVERRPARSESTAGPGRFQDRIEAAGARSGAALVAALMLAHILPYAWAAITADSARDLYMATQVVEGIALPRVGPRVADLVHLGPLWFYLIALPLALSKSVAATFCFVGLLAALKFPAGYALGRAVASRGAGLAIAGVLAVPGWNQLQSALPTHTNLIEASMLGALLALVRLHRGAGGAWWLVYSGLQGLALQAHPATVIVAPFALLVLLRRGSQALRADVAYLAAGLLLPLAMFLPTWLDQTAPVVAPVAQIVARAGALDIGSETLKLLGGLGRAWLHPLGAAELSPSLEVVVNTLRWACAVTAGFILLIGLARDGRVRLALVALVAACLMLVLMRDSTPYYMSYALLPFAAVFVGLAWRRTALLGRAGRMLAMAFALLVGVLALAAPALRIANAERGVLQLAQGRIGNVRESWPGHVGGLLPAVRFDAWGARVCARRRPVTLHGDLAFFVDAGLALSVRLQCADTGLVRLGGADGADHVAGLLPDQRTRLGLSPEWEQVFAIGPLRALGPQRSEAPARGGLLELRPERESAEPVGRSYRFTAGPRDVVSLGLPLGYYQGGRLEWVKADGVVQESWLDGAVTTLYRCAACGGEEVTWEVTLASGDVSSLDVVVLPSSAFADAP